MVYQCICKLMYLCRDLCNCLRTLLWRSRTRRPGYILQTKLWRAALCLCSWHRYSISLYYLNKPIQVLALPKQTHAGSYVPLFKNLRTASQGQHQIAKAEKSTEHRLVFFPHRYSCKAIVCLLWWQVPTGRELSPSWGVELRDLNIKEGLRVGVKYRNMKKAMQMRHWFKFSIPAELRTERRL